MIIYLLVWYGPDLIARHDIGNVAGLTRTLRLQQARDAARGRLLTLGAGLFAAGALIFTAQNYRVARKTLEVTEQGQVTDRYTKAIKQLGSAHIDVRIGGIYALERIAVDSPRDHSTVTEVLAAFIREHSRTEGSPRKSGQAVTRRSRMRPDVQAALTVVGRREVSNDIRLVDLSGADLSGADLTLANLAEADLRGVNFSEAWAASAIFTNACLVSATFERATIFNAAFIKADLSGANFTQADLTDADLTEANLTGADLSGAILIGVNAMYASLVGAKLGGATIDGVNFTRANLTDIMDADLKGANLFEAKLNGLVPED